jgi:hypothetical protein
MWYYENKEFNPSEDDIKDYAGFVYQITENKTSMKYIGKKLFWKTIKRPPLKGKKRKRIEIVQSDWKTYFGSSEKVKLLVEQNGQDSFKREILRFCKTKGELSYFEAKIQFEKDVLLRDDYYNGIINCRIPEASVRHLR